MKEKVTLFNTAQFKISKRIWPVTFMAGCTLAHYCNIHWLAKQESSANLNRIRSSNALHETTDQRWKIEFIWGNWILIYWQTTGLPLGACCVCLRAIHSNSLCYLKCVISCGETAIRRHVNWCHRVCVYQPLYWEETCFFPLCAT